MVTNVIRAKTVKKPTSKRAVRQFYGYSFFNLSGFHICDISDKKNLRRKSRTAL